MKYGIQSLILFVVLIVGIKTSHAQELTNAYKEQAIERLNQLMHDLYVHPDVAKKTADHLTSQWKEGHFNQFKNDDAFAAALTESVQTINKDKHMRIWKNKPYEAPEDTPERQVEEHLDQIDRSRRYNAGFHTVEIMEGNVGYLDLRGFAGMESGKATADAYMQLMVNADAIMIDLSHNGGGSPDMVQYLCSYFFDELVHLNSLYWRASDETQEFWTLEQVDGKKLSNVPLFVLTSERTFSGAEEFSYNMQTQKRATLVGQTTGGGANPGGSRPINNNLTVFIPTGRAINPVTKTSWEGTGVIPEVTTTVEDRLTKAHELAKDSAEKFRQQRKEVFNTLQKELSQTISQYENPSSDEALLKQLKKCQAAEMHDEGGINMLGYEYLMQRKKPKVAIAIFRSNTKLYPNSANVFDSYAESLMMSGDLDASLTNYQRAVELARQNNDRDTELFEQNLENIKKKIKEKK